MGWETMEARGAYSVGQIEKSFLSVYQNVGLLLCTKFQVSAIL